MLFRSVVIILLIQIGGLGVMTLTSFFAMFFMGNTSLYNQLVVRDMVSSNSLNSLLSTLVYILAFTLVIEGTGLQIESDISYGYLNHSFQNAVFEGIRMSCQSGLHGWEVTDLKVTFTQAEYYSPVSTPDRKSTRLNSSHDRQSRMPSSA